MHKSKCLCISQNIEPTKIHKPVLYIVLIMLIAAILTFLNNVLKGIFIQVHGSNYPVFGYIPWVTFIVACITLYLFLFLRLFYSFQDSQYAMSSKAIKCHIIVLFVMTICIIIESIAYNLENDFILLVATLCSTLISTIGVIHLLIYFNRGLFGLIVAQKTLLFPPSILCVSSKSNSNISTLNEEENKRNVQKKQELNSAQKTLLVTVTKHTLLSSMIICNLFCFISILIILLISGAFKYDIIRKAYYWSFQILAELTTLFMWLSFNINDNHYYCLCGQCDICCKKICDMIATNKISKDNVDMENLAVPARSD